NESQAAFEIAPVAFCMLKFCSFKTSEFYYSQFVSIVNYTYVSIINFT
ncbi:hypothetical protein SEEJ0720_04417, partial [Salmonella enterica subsp. enterica serovar Javiana str. PRS_2010_0720]